MGNQVNKSENLYWFVINCCKTQQIELIPMGHSIAKYFTENNHFQTKLMNLHLRDLQSIGYVDLMAFVDFGC